MKINYDFYKGNEIITKQDEFIGSYIDEYFDSDKISKSENSRELAYNFSATRENILNWYPFKKEDEVLEIGSDFGVLTKKLCMMTKNVTTVENSKYKAEKISMICKQHENLEIIVGDLTDIVFTKKFDYIVMIGSFEKAIDYYNVENQYKGILIKLRQLIKKNGKILIATNNQFSLKYFAGGRESLTNREYESLNGYNKSKYRSFGKGELIKLFNETEFLFHKFYYPLPDYKLPNIIFSEEYLPNEKNIVRYNPYYLDEEIINYSEITAYKEIIKNDMFDFFANSYFIEISQTKINNDIININFNNIRKDKYKLTTFISKGNVYKYNTTDLSKEHYNNFTKNLKLLSKLGFDLIEKIKENYVESKFVNAKKLDEIIIENINNKNIVFNILQLYYNMLKIKLIIVNKDENIFKELQIEVDENIDKLTFVKYGFFDMTLQNIFYIENKLIVFDQEWLKNNIPLEFIFYRSIKILSQTINIDMYFIDEIYIKYNIKDYINLFEKLEKYLQDELLDNDSKRFYTYNPINVYLQHVNDVKKLEDYIENIIKEKEKLTISQQKLNKIENNKLIKILIKLKIL